MVSERKLKANRRNAKRSTGPKNTTRSRYNAQKHGRSSKAVFIQDGDAKEDPREFEALSDELWEDLKPVDFRAEGGVVTVELKGFRTYRMLLLGG